MGWRCLRKLLWKEDGAVTIFAVVVLSSLLLFFSLLIDYARIAALHKMTEDAARSSIRSVLSAYDASLYERYGLFGRGGTDGQSILMDVMAENMGGKSSSASGGFHLIDPRLEDGELHTAAVLGEHDVFARQVLEEMKYKAPIDFSLEIAAKFIPIAGAMKEATAAIDLLEQLRRLYEKREAHLEQALKLQHKAAEAISGSEAARVVPIQSGSNAGSDRTAESIAAGYSQYVNQKLHDESLDEETEPSYTAEIAKYEAQAASTANSLRRLSEELQRRHGQHLDDALLELEQAKSLNEEMIGLQQRVNESIPGGYDQVSNQQLPGSEAYGAPTDASEELQKVQQSSEQLLREAEWFDEYKRELRSQAAAADAFIGVMERLQYRIMGAICKPMAETEYYLQSGITSTRQSYAGYEMHYIQPGAILIQRQEVLLDHNVKTQLKEQEKQLGSKWAEAKQLLQGLANVPQTEEHQEIFQLVKERYNNNLLFNQQSNEGGDRQLEQDGDAHEAAERSSKQMGHLFTGMAGMLEKTRDSFYFGEYVVHRYSSFAPQNLRALVKNADVEELSQAVSFYNQEAEYVLYGFHNPLGNLIAAYGELFAVRLAIRTMEGLIQSRSLGHPLLILSAALIYGLERTMEDMISFTNKGTAPLSKYVKVELSYTDYLRLFMLLHSGDEAKRMARIIAVIEQNNGITLAAVPAAVSGETEISMKLWFLPGLMGVLGRFGLLQGKVVGSRYETTHTMGWSY